MLKFLFRGNTSTFDNLGPTGRWACGGHDSAGILARLEGSGRGICGPLDYSAGMFQPRSAGIFGLAAGEFIL